MSDAHKQAPVSDDMSTWQHIEVLLGMCMQLTIKRGFNERMESVTNVYVNGLRNRPDYQCQDTSTKRAVRRATEDLCGL